MVQGDYDLLQEIWYFILFRILIVLASNVILLSLINAILGDVYEEVITVIEEKCLKEQNLTNLRNEALWCCTIYGSYGHFAWIEYVS